MQGSYRNRSFPEPKVKQALLRAESNPAQYHGRCCDGPDADRGVRAA